MKLTPRALHFRVVGMSVVLSGSLVLACAAAQNDQHGWPTPCDGRVLKQEVTNARDLGGYAGANDQPTACAQLFRGGDLTGLTNAGCDTFAELGIQTVVDLRQAAVQTSDPPPACVSNRAELVSAALPKLLPDTPANYLALFDEAEAIRALFGALGAVDNYPLYFHCVIGRDRASFAAALVLAALGVERSSIVAEFALSADAGVAVKTECIEAVLDEIEQRGGIETFLAGAGVPLTDVETLRTVMLPN